MAEDNLIREIDEAMQQERWHQLWKQYGGKILYGCAAIVMLMGGMIAWQQRSTYIAQEHTKSLTAARDGFIAGNYEKAAAAFAELAEKSSGSHRALALLWLAKSHLADEQQAEAIEALAKATEVKEAEVLAKLACTQGAMLAPEDARFAACLPTEKEPFASAASEFKAAQAAATQNFTAALEALPASAMPVSQQQRIEDIKAYAQSAKHEK